MIVKIKKLHPNAKIPQKSTQGSAGYDLFALEDCVLSTNGITKIRTGISTSFSKDYVAHVVPRSGLAFKYGVNIINSPATIDSDYTNEWIVGLFIDCTNHVYLPTGLVIKAGEKFAQIIFKKVEEAEFQEVKELEETERKGGFGSTGRF